MQLYLVRHGDTETGETPAKLNHDNPLSPLGTQQAQAVAQYLVALPERPSVVLASPLLRTWQTADIIAEALGVPTQTDERLGELNVGEWSDRPIPDVLAEYTKVPPEERGTFRPPGGETWLEEGARVADCVNSLKADSAILVSHASPIRCAIGTLLGVDSSQWVDFKAGTGSVSLLVSDNGKWVAEYIGKELTA